jgi:hypothetical protein
MSQEVSDIFTVSGPTGYRGLKGSIGYQGPQGIPGAAVVPAKMPSGGIEMTTPVGTISAVLEDVIGGGVPVSVTVTLANTTEIVANVSVNVKTISGVGASVLGLALVIDGAVYTETHLDLSGTLDSASVSLTARSTPLAAGDHTVTLQFYRVSVADSGVPGVDNATLVAIALQGALSRTPPWHGVLYAATGNCDPSRALDTAVRAGTLSMQQAHLGTGTARVCYFRPPADITVNKIR